MTSDPIALLALLVLWAAFLTWACGDQARRGWRRAAGMTGLALIYLEVAVALLGLAIVVAAMTTAGWAAAACRGVREASRRAWTRARGWGARPGRRVKRMRDRDWIDHVRRDANVAAELAAAAEAALRAIQETGGTSAERAGVLRVVAMARGTAASAVEQIDTADKLDWVASFGRSG